MKRKGKWFLAFLGILVLFFVACMGKKEIRIGLLLPLSGEASNYGQSILKGVRLAEEEINARGIKEFAGYALVLVEEDTNSDAQTGRKAMMRLLNRGEGNCYAILGPASSSVALSCAPIAMQRKRVMLTPSASEPEITKKGNFVYRIYPSDAVEGRKMADFARKKLYIKKVAVVAETTDYAQGLKKVFVKSFRDQGGDVQTIQNYPSGAADLSTHVQAVKDSEAQGIYIVGYDNSIVRLLQEIRQQDIRDDKGKPIRILSCGAFDSPHVFSQPCDLIENVIFPRVAFTCDTEGTDVLQFCEAFKAKYGREPDTFAAHGYDALNLLVHSIEIQGGLYPEEMPMVLATTTNWKGVSGSVTFDANGDVISKFPKVFIVKQCKAMSFDDLMQMLREKERQQWEELQRELEERRKALGE